MAAGETETNSGEPQSAGTRRRWWFWFRLVAAVAILWYVVEKNGRGRIVETLLAADIRWVALAAAVFFLSILAGAYQWHLLLKYQGIDYGYRLSFRTYYAAMFLNNFLPGTVGGDALRVYETRKSTHGWGKPVAATLLDRLFGFFSLSFLSVAAVLLTLWRGTLDVEVFRHLLYTMVVIFACFISVLILLLSRRASSLAHAVIRRTPLKWLDESYARLQANLNAYRSRWRSMGFVFLVSCVVQILRIDVHWFSALGLRQDISPVFFFSFVPVIAIAGVIPLNVGGWGIPQSLAAFLYALPGVLGPAAAIGSGDAKATAAAMAFLPSAVGLVVMLGGGFYFVAGRSGPRKKPPA